MKRSHRQTRNLFIPKWAPLSSISWRRGGLWWVFIPLSGAIAIFWKPMANPDTLNQMGNNISSNLQTLLSPITPYLNTLQDTLERVQNIDPVQPSLARQEESEEFDSTLPTGSDILSDSELQQVIATLSLEEIGQEIESLSPPTLSVSFDLSPSTKKGKNEKKSPLSASHPLVSSVPYWSRKPAQPEPEENKDNNYLYPTVTSILNPDKNKEVESVDSNLPTYTSSIFTPNLTPNATSKVTSNPQLPPTSLSRYSPPQIPTSSSTSPSETQSFGYSRLSPFVNTNNELTPPNPLNPQPQFTAPSGSIRPRGYGLIEPTTSLSNQQ